MAKTFVNVKYILHVIAGSPLHCYASMMTPDQDPLSLRDTWEKVRGISASALRGCGCGMQTPHVSAADFELDLIEYLADRFRHEPRICSVLSDALQSPRPLSTALGRLAALEIDPAIRRQFVEDAQRSIASFSGCVPTGFYCAAP
jgi:hypothetical protein